jgi:Predicted metal-dependent hydrolase with the TIM-barrel fold
MKRIFYNGKLYQERNKFAQAMFVKDGIIEKVGTNEDILSLNENCELIDLKGKTVIPGFNDSHLHLENVGYRLSNLNLYGVKSVDEVIRNAKEYIIDNKIDDVLLGYGWNQDYFIGEKRLLNRHDLDQISRDIPVVLIRICGHILAANSKALEILNIDENTLDVEGGKILREDDGFPNGVFCENAMRLFNKFLNTTTIEQRKNILN